MAEHISVLLNEVISLLAPKDGATYFDGTFGGGGYARAILESADCNVIACDRDPFVKEIAENFFAKYRERFIFFNRRFSDIESIIKSSGNICIDGVVLDLGISNFQISDPERGFSFKQSGPLDMSMGLCEENAFDVLHKYSEEELANIIYLYGEEHFSRKIAKTIKANLSRIKTTENLADLIRKCVKKTGKIDPATKTFQALRIFVNNELGELEKVLQDSVKILKPGGKILVVSFHSLEDRIVKNFFKSLVKDDKTRFQLLSKKAITPSENEIVVNPKSRSAKLRGICML